MMKKVKEIIVKNIETLHNDICKIVSTGGGVHNHLSDVYVTTNTLNIINNTREMVW